MRKFIFQSWTFVILLALGLSACADGENSTSEYSNHCAITSVVMGNLLRTVSAVNIYGHDTLYDVSLSGNAYAMTIDQYAQEIYNLDSLPYGTHVNKVVFTTISADGLVAYRTDGGTDSVYSEGDSLDFTHPRYLVCYPYSGYGKKEYKVTINVHQVQPEDFVWGCVDTCDNLKDVTAQKAFVADEQVYVFALRGTTPILLQTATSDVNNWQEETLSLSDFEPSSVQRFMDKFYAVSAGQVVSSSDGKQWASTGFAADALPAVGSQRLYALKGNQMYVTQDGENWAQDQVLDADKALPTSDFTSIWQPMSFNPNFEYVLMCGKTAQGSVEWKQTVDNTGVETEGWVSYTGDSDKVYPWPALENMQMVAYDDCLLAMGLENSALSGFYISRDCGVTWVSGLTDYSHPENIQAQNFSWLVDDQQYMWIVCGGTGEVWKGRLNRLGFKKNQTSFTE